MRAWVMTTDELIFTKSTDLAPLYGVFILLPKVETTLIFLFEELGHFLVILTLFTSSLPWNMPRN